MMWVTKTLRGIFLSVWGGGKTTLLTVMVALTLATVTPAFGANGGAFILGTLNNSTTAVTRLVGNVAGPTMQLYNTNTAANARALDLIVDAGNPPMTVNASAGKATNLDADKLDGQNSSAFLPINGTAANATNATNATNAVNADKVDGLDSTELQGAKAYAHIDSEGTLDASLSKNVNRSERNATGQYCVNSTVTPRNVVATIDRNSGTGEITTLANNGLPVCEGITTDNNILVNTATSIGANENKAFYIVIN
jgi:hypothetical protein